MKLNITSSEDSSLLKLSGTLDIYSADALRDALTQYVQISSPLLLDLSEVDGCDVAGLQLLCSARKTREASLQSFELTRVSQAVIDSCTALGMRSEQLKVNRLSN